MFEAFVIMLREGVEAALVVGILLVVLVRSSRRDLVRAVFWGLALAVIASIGAAMLLPRLPISEELYEGVLYFVSAIFVGSMMIWVQRRSKYLKRDIEARAQLAMRGSGWREALGLGAFAFLMVFREGAETVMFLSAVNLTTSSVMTGIGAVAGLALAVIFCVMFVRGSVPVDLRRFFLVTEWMLAVFLVQLLINGYHELAEVGVLPASASSMALVGPIVRHNSLFILAIVAIPIGLWITRSGSSKAAEAATARAAGGAAARLEAARRRRERTYRLGAMSCAVVVFLSVCVLYAGEIAPKKVPPPQMVQPQADTVTVPVAALQDGRLHRFGVLTGSHTTRFLAMQTADGRIRTAMDACEICGSKGYVQQGPHLVCLNCSAEIDPMTLGVSGGCNPIPLASEVRDDRLVVPMPDIMAFADLFRDSDHVMAEQIDPVCGMMVAIETAAAFESYEGKTYYFCSERCAERFREAPESYGN